ncbi:hypothetical protein L0Y65_03255 [Candidatus Micrarchaeota archaeon]|nr:hypothetical protein [Candidatus Micrarchaeota archaeon]
MMLTKIKEAAFRPKGFADENALIEGIARGCKDRRTAMLTGNYTVKEGPETREGDPRLLGEQMLLTIELAARVYGRCMDMGIETPAIILLPNDIAPGIFHDNTEERAFKASYSVPPEIISILSNHGLCEEPACFFLRDFSLPEMMKAAKLRSMRRQLKEGSVKLAAIFESYAQNLASKELRRGRMNNPEAIEVGLKGAKQILVPVGITDTFSGELQMASALVSITNPNGSPFCSFLAATLFREFESLGFERMVNTFVMNEYPCVDKAAAAYRYLYGGRMPIRNIYLEGADVVVDSTIA